MSRCECCNNILTPQESVRKFRESGAYTNSCGPCLRDIGIATVEGNVYRGGYVEDDDPVYEKKDDHVFDEPFIDDFSEEDDG